jgi:uncharacterized membrane protein YeaQ/YmgE (transglycosylase-associated protein family)
MKAEETEDLIASLAALGIMILPLSEVVLRRFFNTGVPGAAPFTAHLTLIVGLVGASIAAREGKLLSLATGTMFPEGRRDTSPAIIAALVGALVTTIWRSAGCASFKCIVRPAERSRSASPSGSPISRSPSRWDLSPCAWSGRHRRR